MIFIISANSSEAGGKYQRTEPQLIDCTNLLVNATSVFALPSSLFELRRDKSSYAATSRRYIPY